MSSVQQMSESTKYDFAKFVYISRTTQLIAIVLKLVLLYSESDSMTRFAYLFFTSLTLLNLAHVGWRWFYNIDGRFDLQEMVNEENMQNRIQYGFSLYLPIIMGLFTWYFIPCGRGFRSTLFHGSALIQMIAALGLIGLEFYEVYVLKKTIKE